MSEIVINVTKTEKVVTINATPNVTQILVNTNSGGGSVNSVFGRTGNVTAQSGDYTTAQITESTNKKFVTDAEKTAITHTNRNILDLISEAFTTTLKSTYDGVVSGYNSLIATGERLITNAEITKLSNTSGTNTGDETTLTIQTKRPLKTINGESLEGAGNVVISGGAVDSVNGLTGVVVLGDLSNLDQVDTDQIITHAVTNAKLAQMNSNTLKGRLSGNGTPQDIAMADLPISTTTQSALNNKVDKSNWIDISLTSTIVGFSSFTSREIRYILGNKTATFFVRIVGTSNSANFTFTIPFNAIGTSIVACQVTNNGTDQTALGILYTNAGSNVVQVKINGAFGNFSTSNGKAIATTFIIETT